MLNNTIPANMQTDFLRETEADDMPEIRREGDTVIFPAFIREYSRQIEDGTTATGYRYFEVPVPFSGQNLTDYAAFALQSYAAIRKFFFGPPEVQNEQILKGTFTAHQYAVKQAFPKRDGETFENITEYEKIKADFWTIIDAVAEIIGKTREDFPTGTSADLLRFCAENGLTPAQIADFAIKILGITADLTRFGRNWNELFR